MDGNASRSGLRFERPTQGALGGLRKFGRAQEIRPGLRCGLDQGDEPGSLRPYLSSSEQESGRLSTNLVRVVWIGEGRHSGSIIWPLISKLPLTDAAPLPGWPPPTDTVYLPWATMMSPASVTMLRSRLFR